MARVNLGFVETRPEQTMSFRARHESQQREARRVTMGSILAGLAGQVSKPYFPFIIFLLSVANTFAVFLSGGVTALYVSTCAAVGRRRFILVALCNAAGALVGFTAFAILVEKHGVEWVRDRHPEILASKHWSRAESAMETFGPAGVVGLSAAPFPLHPLVLVALLTGMRKETVLAAVFLGRLVKYTVFGWIATSGSDALRRIGVKSDAVADAPDAPEAKKTR